MSPIELVLSKLPDAKRTGESWSARCPAHDDRHASLSVSEGDDRRVLLHCHAGCAVDSIVAALGIRKSDLFPEHGAGYRRGAKPCAKQSTKAAGEMFATAREAIHNLEWERGDKRSACWTYHNANGEPAGVVVRWETPAGKDIRPVSKTPVGWLIGGMPIPRPLYRLPEVLKADGRVYVCEGEKAVEALRSMGLIGTTSPHGSNAASKTDWQPLAGRDVVILPDNDDPGAKYAADVANILTHLSPPAMVRLVNLPDLPEGGDFVEYLAARKAAGLDDNAIRAELDHLADAAPVYETPTIANEKRGFVDVDAPPEPAVEVWRPFPVEILPEPVQSFVTTSAKAVGCDPCYLALPLLAGLASAIGNTRRIQLKRGWTEPAIVWAVIVGESGTLKSPALELGLRPIRKRQREAMKQYRQAMEVYQTEAAHYEREMSRWKRSKDSDDPPVNPELPIPERCWCDDVTVEAIAVLLQRQPRGLLVAPDELSTWLGSFDRYAQKAGGDAAKWSEMFGGRSMVVDRKSGDRPMIFVDRAAVSITGGIQPETLRRALGVEHRENGLAARLLLACPPHKPKRWNEADIPSTVEGDLEAVFDQLYALEPATDDSGDPRPWIVKLTPGGKRAWVTFYNEHAAEHVDLSGDLSAAWSKLEAYAARLALVTHFVRWAAGDSTLVDPDGVDEESTAAGVALSRWFGHEARRVYSILTETDDDRDQRRLLELVQRKGGVVTARDLQQSSRLYKAADAAEIALSELAKAGFGGWEDREPTAKGGRPTRVFRLSRPSTVYETPINPWKSEGFVDVDSVDTSEGAVGDDAPEPDPDHDWTPDDPQLDAPNEAADGPGDGYPSDDDWGEI